MRDTGTTLYGVFKLHSLSRRDLWLAREQDSIANSILVVAINNEAST
jgi:hypothetical protein